MVLLLWWLLLQGYCQCNLVTILCIPSNDVRGTIAAEICANIKTPKDIHTALLVVCCISWIIRLLAATGPYWQCREGTNQWRATGKDTIEPGIHTPHTQFTTGQTYTTVPFPAEATMVQRAGKYDTYRPKHQSCGKGFESPGSTNTHSLQTGQTGLPF